MWQGWFFTDALTIEKSRGKINLALNFSLWSSSMNPNFYSHMLNMCLYSLSAMVLMFFCFKLFDWVTPWMHFKTELVEKQNSAVAVVVGSFVLGIAIVIAVVLSTP